MEIHISYVTAVSSLSPKEGGEEPGDDDDDDDDREWDREGRNKER